MASSAAASSSRPCLYWEDLLDAQAKTFKPADEIRKIYQDRGVAAVASR